MYVYMQICIYILYMLSHVCSSVSRHVHICLNEFWKDSQSFIVSVMNWICRLGITFFLSGFERPMFSRLVSRYSVTYPSSPIISDIIGSTIGIHFTPYFSFMLTSIGQLLSTTLRVFNLYMNLYLRSTLFTFC